MATDARSRVPSAAANGKGGHSLISDAKFRQIYTLALKLRLLAQRGRGTRSLAGREAALAGSAADLRADDVVLTAENVSLWDELGTAWPGSEAQDRTSIVKALSGAVADRLEKTRRVTVIFFDSAREDSDIAEARRIADAAKLPVLFIEDRRGEEEAAQPQSANEAALSPIGAMPVVPVDAQDVVAIYRVAHESIARAREGTGPTHVQCFTWKPAGERKSAANGRRTAATADAVEHLEQWLESRGLPAQAWRQEIVAKIGNGTQGRTSGKGSSRRREQVQELHSTEV
jgi:TPP-dependent pyruvate/acetoin dehydrogenase alpha subunit